MVKRRSYKVTLLFAILATSVTMAEQAQVGDNANRGIGGQAAAKAKHDAAMNSVRNIKATGAGDADNHGGTVARTLGEGTGTKGGKALADVVTNRAAGDDITTDSPSKTQADIGNELHPPKTQAAPIREGGKTISPNPRHNTVSPETGSDMDGDGRADSRSLNENAGHGSEPNNAKAHSHESTHSVQQGASAKGGFIKLDDVKGEAKAGAD